MLDTDISNLAARHTNPTIQQFTRAATWAAADKVLGTVIAAAWCLSRFGDRRQRGIADHLALTTVAAMSVPKMIKKVVDRKRPDRCVVGHDRRGVGTSGNALSSFPSGHSVHVAAIASALGRAYPEKKRALWAAGGLLAATRIAVLAHWPSDVAVGLALGVALERGVWLLSGDVGSELERDLLGRHRSRHPPGHDAFGNDGRSPGFVSR